MPYRNQPPPGALVQACSVAVVLPLDRAVTVRTRVAVPVLNDSGSDCPRTSGGFEVDGRGAGRCVTTAAGRVVRAGGADTVARGRGADVDGRADVDSRAAAGELGDAPVDAALELGGAA